jgi:pyruvate formate lyase activating enzyme
MHCKGRRLTAMKEQGTVFNIQRYTIHDGPGLRTEFFLKGCPLSCKWCGNPESQKFKIEIGVYTSKCIGQDKCGACVEVCPNEGALVFTDGKLTSIDYNKCNDCLACVDACPTEAIKQWGQVMTVEECMKVIRKDKGYYERSGGGVTVSGGDPLMQSEFVASLFKACKEEGFHTCFESDFHANWKRIEDVLPYTDLFIADIKHMDSEVHKAHTGVPNETILENLRKLSKKNIPIILRTPVIPGFNDFMENMEASADFIVNELGGNVRTLQLLSYMRLGEEKYKSLNLDYPMSGLEFNREELTARVKKYVDYFNSRGIHCLAGTKER